MKPRVRLALIGAGGLVIYCGQGVLRHGWLIHINNMGQDVVTASLFGAGSLLIMLALLPAKWSKRSSKVSR